MLGLPLAGLLVVVQAQSLTQESPGECNVAGIVGSLNITGQPLGYLAGGRVTSNGQALTMQHLSGVSMMSACDSDTWRPENIMQLKLLGRTMRFTVDLSGVGCACNLAFYLIGSPAKDEHGDPSRGKRHSGQPPYYCDANKVGGQWCPEIDIMEANNHMFSSTIHKCGAPTNGHYKWCDRVGCRESTKDLWGLTYGPGTEYTINTLSPFDVITEFLEQDGTLSGMRTTLEQAGRKEFFHHSNCDQWDLSSLSYAMREGMSLRVTYWGSDAQTMAWLDKPVCGKQTCSRLNAGDAVISAISVSNGTVKVQPQYIDVMRKFTGTRLSSLLGSSTRSAIVLAAVSACFVSFLGMALLIVGRRLCSRPRPQEFERHMPTGDMLLETETAQPTTYDRLPLAEHLKRAEDLA